MIEELAGLPVNFDRNVAATIQVGMNLSPIANDESWRRPVSADFRRVRYLETDPFAAVLEFLTGAKQSLLHA